jgi:hypothetical protein
MSCPEVTTLEEMALDVLQPTQHPALLTHLAGCRYCRATLRVLTEAADQLLLAVPPSDPPPGFVAAVAARLSTPPSPRRLAPV